MQRLADLTMRAGSANDSSLKATLNYLQNLSEIVGVEIVNWDMDEILKKPDGTITHSHVEINRRFFEKLKLAPPPIMEIREELRADLAEYNHKMNSGLDPHVEQQIAQYRRSIASSVQSITNYTREIAKQEAIKRTNKMDYEKIVKDVIQNHFFSFNGVDPSDPKGFGESSLDFVTKNCVIDYQNPNGKRMVIPFGKFKIKLYAKRALMEAYPFQENILWKSTPRARDVYNHPFISLGSICFGNASEAFSIKMGKQNYPEAFALLQSLLTSYHSAVHPYVRIEAFYYAGQYANGTHPWRDDADQLTDEQDRAAVGLPPMGTQTPPLPGMTAPVEHEEGDYCDRCEGEHPPTSCDRDFFCSRCEQWWVGECEDCEPEYTEDDSDNDVGF